MKLPEELIDDLPDQPLQDWQAKIWLEPRTSSQGEGLYFFWSVTDYSFRLNLAAKYVELVDAGAPNGWENRIDVLSSAERCFGTVRIIMNDRRPWYFTDEDSALAERLHERFQKLMNPAYDLEPQHESGK
jgi:hypothetical protein